MVNGKPMDGMVMVELDSSPDMPMPRSKRRGSPARSC
jgi:hypothetical protein